MLSPVPSSAVTQGWKCVIISDQLTVRNYNGSEAWKADVELNIPSSIAAAVAGSTGGSGSISTLSMANSSTSNIMELGHQLQKQFKDQATPGSALVSLDPLLSIR